MANYDDRTRKEQVLAKLKLHAGNWVDGVELANEQVGGSEGLKRLRELRDEGWLIQKRRSPVQGSDQFQYRLAVQLQADGGLAYYDPNLHKEDPHGSEPRSDPAAPVTTARPQPVQSTWMDPASRTRESDTSWSDWKKAPKTPGTLEHVFWFRDGSVKQRVIGAIGPLGDGRWGWGLLVPANKSRLTPQRRLSHGVAADKDAARAAVEEAIRELRSQGGIP